MTLGPETLREHRRGEVFVETGTYHGDGIRAALDAGFQTVYSIELNEELYKRAVEEFRDDPRVHLVHGDSALELGSIVATLEGAEATLWLDAHASGPLRYDGGTPIVHEIRAIAKSGCKATILIDDCRLMGSAEWGYVTKNEILRALDDLPYAFEVSYTDGYQKDDIMVVTPV